MCPTCSKSEHYFPNIRESGPDLRAGKEVEVAEAGHDQQGRGQECVESPRHLWRHSVLQPPVAGLAGHHPGHALEADAQEVEEGPDEDEVHGAVPHEHEREADGAAQELGEEGGRQEGDDWKIDVAGK